MPPQGDGSESPRLTEPDPVLEKEFHRDINKEKPEAQINLNEFSSFVSDQRSTSHSENKSKKSHNARKK